MGTWLNAFLPPLLWAGLIFFLSAQPTLPSFDVTILDFIFRKAAHMTVYAVLYFLLHRGIQLVTHQTTHSKTWWVTWFLCFFYAVTDEFHQSFVSNRTPSFYDVGYDMLGTSLTFLWMYRYI